jgi:hypothetical protein
MIHCEQYETLRASISSTHISGVIMALGDVAAWAALGLTVANGLYNLGYQRTDLRGAIDTAPVHVSPVPGKSTVSIIASIPLVLMNDSTSSLLITGMRITAAQVDPKKDPPTDCSKSISLVSPA